MPLRILQDTPTPHPRTAASSVNPTTPTSGSARGRGTKLVPSTLRRSRKQLALKLEDHGNRGLSILGKLGVNCSWPEIPELF